MVLDFSRPQKSDTTEISVFRSTCRIEPVCKIFGREYSAFDKTSVILDIYEVFRHDVKVTQWHFPYLIHPRVETGKIRIFDDVIIGRFLKETESFGPSPKECLAWLQRRDGVKSVYGSLHIGIFNDFSIELMFPFTSINVSYIFRIFQFLQCFFMSVTIVISDTAFIVD